MCCPLLKLQVLSSFSHHDSAKVGYLYCAVCLVTEKCTELFHSGSIRMYTCAWVLLRVHGPYTTGMLVSSVTGYLVQKLCVPLPACVHVPQHLRCCWPCSTAGPCLSLVAAQVLDHATDGGPSHSWGLQPATRGFAGHRHNLLWGRYTKLETT